MSKNSAFLFFDADAARDVSHLNRLERGCYFDIMQAQKKFGRMKLELLRKVLGNDFDSCWKNLEISLYCEQEYYYIPWLEESIRKRDAYCASRGRNRFGSRQNSSMDSNHKNNACQDQLFPEQTASPAPSFTMNKLKTYFAQALLKKEQISMLYRIAPERLEDLIARFCLKENEYASQKDALAHFLYWLDRQNKSDTNHRKTLVEQWME